MTIALLRWGYFTKYFRYLQHEGVHDPVLIVHHFPYHQFTTFGRDLQSTHVLSARYVADGRQDMIKRALSL